MRRILLGLMLTAIVAVALWHFWIRERPTEEAFVGERRVTMWSRLAQVREPVGMLRYGERVAILERKAENVRVRITTGATGWVNAAQLIAPALWERAAGLREQVKSMPVQARGRTRVVANVRAEPGRAAPRIFHLRGSVPVDVFARAVVEWTPAAEEASSKEAKPEPPDSGAPEVRREDWLLVRAAPEEVGEVAGWVRASFVEPDLPEPLQQYATGMRFVAWFELNRVPEFPPGEAGGAADEKGQYLALATTGGEGRPCDFTLLRVYTWDAKRRRYETAYVESNLCGRLPVRLTQEGGLAVFRFKAIGVRGEEPREYRMRQNIVRRVREKSGGR